MAAAARPQVGGTVTVGNGETLFAISRRTGVPVRALIDANGLKPPYGLLTGQRIAVPANRFHEVQPGETLYSVSRRYGVAMSVLVSENGLDAPYGVRAGQRLKVPTPAATSAPETMVAAVPPPNSLQPPPGQILQPPAPQVLRPPPGAEPQPQPQPEPAPPVEPPPQVGFLTPPAITAPEPVLPPQRPGRAAPPAPPPAAEAPPEPTVQPEPAPRPELAPRRGRDRVRPEPPPAVAPVVPPPPPAMAMAPPPEPPPTAGPPPREGRGFAWPVRGQVVTRFGPTGRGLHNDGINIAAPKGAAVLSAEAGIVAYAGNELRGFGNLLLVKHADGWVTAYAHNDSLLVKRGDRIRRGQPIARVGQTGNVGEPQLHFEIRRGTRAVDPAEYLVGRSTELVPELAPPRLRTHPAVLLAALPGPG
ncbi:hypothetical protein STHU_15300 [Allostella humosa]|uniref:peptidoglycan DD-metalloendopeptidase family protein n=1 Tax=Stella humosa TaxID=94 RepID=UPI000F4BAD5E|nr:peptidoglycan DD-metalloendopeptidase family protein [Stella humosa]BBK30896.1 hypothetical protein STHU_15300 [Stella humosa]